jgi:hypothetical protein
MGGGRGGVRMHGGGLGGLGGLGVVGMGLGVVCAMLVV